VSVADLPLMGLRLLMVCTSGGGLGFRLATIVRFTASESVARSTDCCTSWLAATRS
jgi:hypothetical protein